MFPMKIHLFINIVPNNKSWLTIVPIDQELITIVNPQAHCFVHCLKSAINLFISN